MPNENVTAKELLEAAFSKIKELGETPSHLLPNGVASLALDIQSEDGKALSVSLRLDGPLNRPALTTGTVPADDENEDATASFNAEGHHIVVLIAKADLQERLPATWNTIHALLASVNRTELEAATFPDDIRNSQPQTKPFHFIDIPFTAGGPTNPPLPAPPHIVSQIVEVTSLLATGSGSSQTKADALSWLIHLTGDIHQPLHCIEHVSEEHPGGDRGGNSFKLRGNAKNLHSLWDSSVEFSGKDEAEVAISVRAEHSRASLSRELKEESVEAWARVSYQIARKSAYTLQENPANPPKPSTAYLVKANQIGRRQAALAGYRLADQLKVLFG